MHGRLLDMLQNGLVIELNSMGLEQPDIAEIMRDFAHGRRHTWMTFQVKLSHWLHLPWHFFGIAHQRLDTARAICRRCLLLRDGSPPTADDHWLVVLLCVTIRHELEKFAHLFADLETLPVLSRMVVAVSRYRVK